MITTWKYEFPVAQEPWQQMQYDFVQRLFLEPTLVGVEAGEREIC